MKKQKKHDNKEHPLDGGDLTGSMTAQKEANLLVTHFNGTFFFCEMELAVTLLFRTTRFINGSSRRK